MHEMGYRTGGFGEVPGDPEMGRRELEGQVCLSFEAEPRQGLEASDLSGERSQKTQVGK